MACNAKVDFVVDYLEYEGWEVSKEEVEEFFADQTKLNGEDSEFVEAFREACRDYESQD